MSDTPTGGDLEPIAQEQAESAEPQDREIDYDNLDDAINALADDEEYASDEEPQTETDDDGEDQGDDSDEDPEAEAEDEESDEADAIVELPDGETLTLSEIADLQANGLRGIDYTHKTEALAREREAVEETKTQYTERLQYAETALQNIAGFVQGLIPAEPDIQLAQTNPAAYTQQKAVREAAILELNKLTTIGRDVAGHKSEASDADTQAYRNGESAALAKAMPHLADPVKKAAFDKAVAETAQEFGFSAEEIAETADHRGLQLVHYARMGKRSEQNRNNAKRRVQTPSKGKAKPAQQSAKQTRNRQAMQRLSKSGDYDDALQVDF